MVKTGMMGVAGFRLEPMGVSMAQKSKNEHPKENFLTFESGTARRHCNTLGLECSSTASTVYQRVERFLTIDHIDMLASITQAVRYHKKNNNKRLICFPFSARNKYLTYLVLHSTLFFVVGWGFRVLWVKRV